MEFWDVIQKRRSVRSFLPNKQISREQIQKIITAGKRAPSAKGIYPVEFIAIEEASIIEQLGIAARGQKHVLGASVLIVVVADVEKSAARCGSRGRDLYAIQDAAAAVENMLLTIVDLGLASCWIGAFEEAEVSRILNLPGNERPLTLLPIGYAV